MSDEDDTYRPRSPDLSGFDAPLPRLNRLPSYSYAASPFFSPQSTTPSTSYFGPRVPSTGPHQSYSPVTVRTPSLPTTTPSTHNYSSVPSHSQHLPPSYNNPFPSYYAQPQSAPGFSATDYHPQQFHPFSSPSSGVSHHPSEMARTRQRKVAEDPESDFNPNHSVNEAYPIKSEQAQPPQSHTSIAIPDPSHGIEVKTKFPVARIKRIMQADEDVGKVAQATPTAVSKALELFMITLVTKGAVEARTNGSKRVTAQHLKAGLMKDSQFDFLTEICESIPDDGSKKGRAKSEARSEDSDEEIAPKRKAKSRKRKASTDDDTD